MAGAEWLNRYVSIDKEGQNTYGEEASGTQVFGEVDDESFKATFDLLVRSDMARQVASKAVTNTRYTEGSINFAVQPDNFMGNIIASFFPKRIHKLFYDKITFTNRGYGWGASSTVSSGLIKDVSDSNLEIGYYEIKNGIMGAVPGSNHDYGTPLAAGNTGGDLVLAAIANGSAWETVNGGAVSASNLGYGIVGAPTDGTTNAGFYFSYSGVDHANNKLTGAKAYSDGTFTTRATPNSAVTASIAVIQYFNGTKLHGIEPGRFYGFITNPFHTGLSANLDLVEPTDSADGDFTGAAALENTGFAAPTGAFAAIGADTHHLFLEPTLTTEFYPSYTVRIGRESKEHTFTGMVTTRLSLSANLNEYVMASVDFLGQAEQAPSAINESVSYSGNDVDALHFSGAQMYVDGQEATTTKIQSVSLEININRDLDSAYAVGSNSITRIPPSRTREITGTMEFNEILYNNDATSVGEPTYEELATATAVHKIHSGKGKPALKFKFQDADRDDSDYLEINLFNVRFEAPTASVSGRDPARMSVGFQAFYDSRADGADKAIEVKMKGAQLQTSDY